MPGRQLRGSWRIPSSANSITATRLCEHSAEHGSKLRAGLRVAQERLGIDAVLAQQITGQIKAAGASVLADVAANIGELHGNAQVSGAGEGVVILNAHQHSHHDADGARHSCAIVTDLCQRVVIPALGVPLETLEQGIEESPAVSWWSMTI